MRSLAVLSLLAACGSSLKPAPVGNSAPSRPALAVKDGMFPCGFTLDPQSGPFGPYLCTVKNGHITKSGGGYAHFDGELTPGPNHSVHLAAAFNCEMRALCHFAFSADLVPDPDGTFKGIVHTASTPDQDYGWFLAGTFDLQRGAYGGDQYGAAQIPPGDPLY